MEIFVVRAQTSDSDLGLGEPPRRKFPRQLDVHSTIRMSSSCFFLRFLFDKPRSNAYFGFLPLLQGRTSRCGEYCIFHTTTTRRCCADRSLYFVVPPVYSPNSPNSTDSSREMDLHPIRLEALSIKTVYNTIAVIGVSTPTTRVCECCSSLLDLDSTRDFLNNRLLIYSQNCGRHQSRHCPVNGQSGDLRKLHTGFVWTANEGEQPENGGPIGGIPIREEVSLLSGFIAKRERRC
jgi:hypothetical protein